MSTINQIKSKLLELEGGRFQRLCDDWLFKKGYENINSIGMMNTTDRVVKGTPDCLIIQPNGQYVFSEYSVQQDHLAKKLEDDIFKCFDQTKTGISDDLIGEIIICYLGKLSTKEIDALRKMCSDRGVVLSLYGLDTIALSIKNTYPILSEQYLDLPLDTGQLLPVEDFVKRYSQNKLTTSIENKLLFKDDVIAEAELKLDTSNFLLVSGPAGTGKTLFSVNLAEIMSSKDKSLSCICLFDKGADLTKDINSKFSQPGDYLIFIDDANRLDNRIDYILHYLHEQDADKRFRIIATVRDYAREQVKDKAGKFTSVEEIIVSPLSDEQIAKLTDELFGIKNPTYHKRIQDIALGNPRLAVMASKVAVETNQIESIQNVTSLYDDYYGQNESVKEVVEDERLMLAACCVSFFRKIDKLNQSQVEMLEANFDLRIEELWELVGYLHSKEMVDIYENEVVRISDQVLSTYFFYLAVFVKKVVPFSALVEGFYPSMKTTIVDSLNPVINAFDHKVVIANIRGEVKSIFENLRNNRETEKAIAFLQTFWFALPTETLVFVKSLVDEMPKKEVNWNLCSFDKCKNDSEKLPLVNLLALFRYFGESEFKISIELLFDYLIKEDSALNSVLSNLEEIYSFKPDDWKYRYYVQKYVVDKVFSLMDGTRSYLFSKVFLVLLCNYLKTEYRHHRWNTDGRTVSIITFRLAPDKYVLNIRETLFFGLSLLIGTHEHDEEAVNVLKEYIGRVRYEGSELAIAELALIQSHIIPRLDVSDVSHCLLMHDYCEALDSLELAYPEEWKAYSLNESVVLSNLLIEDRHERKMLEMSYEEYNKYRNSCLDEFFSGYTIEKFTSFVENCIALHASLKGRERDFQLKNGVELSLIALSEVNPEQYKDLVNIYLKYDDVFNINPHFVVKALFETLPSKNVWHLLCGAKFKWKHYWISAYFTLIPEKDITVEEARSLITHVSACESSQLRGWLDYLDKYRVVEPQIYSKVVNLLVERSKEDINFSRSLGFLFRKESSIFGDWFNVFNDEGDLVTEAYLAVTKLEGNHDYHGEALKLLVEHDFRILFEIVDLVYDRERWPDTHTAMPDINFLWDRKEFVAEIVAYGRYIYEKEHSPFSLRESIFCKLFDKKNGQSSIEDIFTKQKLFFRHVFEKYSEDIGFICFIFEAVLFMPENFRREMIAVFVKNNSNIEDFKKIDYAQTQRSWSGSPVPILEKEKRFQISLLSVFNTAELLEHRFYIEQSIEAKDRDIEFYKKRDFLENR